MSDNKEQNLGITGAYGKLLDVATSAKGDEKMDANIGPMSDEDKKWLENALSEFAANSDPVRKLKELIAKLMNYDRSTDENLQTLAAIVDSLIDLVCDLDFALDFCKLSGLKAIEDLVAKKDDQINQLIIPIISEIGQNNQPVQKIIIQSNLLPTILELLKDESTSQKTRLKCVSASSAIVKGFPPAVIRFVQLQGPDIILKTFNNAFNADDQALVHRCVVAIRNIGASAAPELIRALKVDVDQYLIPMREKLNSASDKYAESLEYLES